MTVSSYATKNGRRWEVRYRKPDGSTTRKRGFQRRKDADAWEATHVTVAKASGAYVDPSAGNVTIDALWGRYLSAHEAVWKPSHVRDQESAYRIHVAPAFGPRRVSSLTHGEVQDWVSSIARERSASTVLKAFGVLKSCVENARRDRLIADTTCIEHIALPRKPGRKENRYYLSPDELVQLADLCGSHRLLVLVLGLTGIRWGEATGLRAGDVDVERGVLHVRRSVTRIGDGWAVTEPKTWERRDVPVPASLMRLLAQELPQDADALVFPGDDGGWLRQQSSTRGRGWWSRAIWTMGVGQMACHDLRHTAASIAVSAGANVKALQRMLGHKSASMTLDVYADLFDSDLLDVSRRVDVDVAGLLS